MKSYLTMATCPKCGRTMCCFLHDNQPDFLSCMDTTCELFGKRFEVPCMELTEKVDKTEKKGQQI